MSMIYYEPKPGKISDCAKITTYSEFISEISLDQKLLPEQKALLKLLATRFIEFKYEKLADYYSITDSHMQKWLERLRCVIVDDNSAIENGYLQYDRSYKALIRGLVQDGENKKA